MAFVVQFCVIGFVIVLAGWLAPQKWQTRLIALLTFIAFCYFDWVSSVLLATLGIMAYGLTNGKHKLLILSVLTLLIAIFIAVKLNKTFTYNYQYTQPILLGFSFYMFRLIHLCIERYKGNLTSTDLWTWLQYLLFFPVLVIGPINRIETFERELRRRRWDTEMISAGLERLLYGFVKIVFFGNYITGIVMELYLQKSDWEVTHWVYQYLDSFQYAFNAYFQFAGYTDLAIGLGLLMGVRLPENFNFPFLATSLSNFWQRWHISLSVWCRDYIYMPVASYTRWPIIGILVSMLILGLWHEFSWRYIAWALFHGLGLVIGHLVLKGIGEETINKTQLKPLKWLVTFNFVVFSFGIIKDDNLEKSINAIKVLFMFT